MEWVANNYGDYVTMSTFGAWAEATGQHGFREHMGRMFYDAYQEGDRHRAVATLPRFAAEWRAPTNTRFDRYLPWVARELNRIFKPYRRLVKKEGLRSFPRGYDLGSRRFTLLHRESDAHRPLLNALAIQTRTLQDAFRGIVDWAEGTGVDLNEYQWDDALGLASSWGVETHGGQKVSQGEVVYAFDDGWTVQELTTAEQLADEDDAMQHCVGEYFNAVESGEARIFSLRDQGGRPHATMEWSPELAYAVQLKGKQNVAPQLEYLLRMVPFRRAYLEPLSKVRPTPGQDPGLLDEFQEEIVGFWTFNPRGNLRDLIGGFGALEAAMEDDRVYVVYRGSQGFPEAYSAEDLWERLRAERQDFLNEAELTGEDDPEEWADKAVKQWARDRFVSADPKRHPHSALSVSLAVEEESGGLDWALWDRFGQGLRLNSDEMVEALEKANVHPGDPRIVPSEGVAEIKARLLR
jgi:hypothetical protein